MKKIESIIHVIIINFLFIFSLSNVVLAKEGINDTNNSIELIKQTLTISGDTVKFVGIIATIILTLIIFLIGFQVIRSYQFEKEFKEIKKLMMTEYEKLLKIRADSETFVSETKSKLSNLENFLGELATNFLAEKTSEIISKEVKEETERRISVEMKIIDDEKNKDIELMKKAVDDEKNRNIELMKKIETLDLTLTPTVYFERGSIYLDQKNYEKAIESFTKAIELKGNEAETYTKRAFSYFNIKKYDEALRDYIKSNKIKPNDKRTLTSIGVTYRIKEKYDDAIKYLDIAIKLDPKYEFAYNQKAFTYFDMKKYDLAINELLNIYKVDSNNPSYSFSLGLFYGKLGDYKTAIDYYLISLGKLKSIDTMLNLSETYLCNEEYLKAEELANECYSMSRNIKDKIMSKYIFLSALILNNKEYKLELKSFVDLIAENISVFEIGKWSFDEISNCLKGDKLQKQSVELIKKIIGLLKGEINGKDFFLK